MTIKFRCVDKHMRPTGYENNEELIVTRQITKDKVTKFFVNGVSSNLTKVRNLFRSEQARTHSSSWGIRNFPK